MGLSNNSWQSSANDRLKWRIYDECQRFEIDRINHCNVKRALRKGDVGFLPTSVSFELSCDICGKLALSKAGLATSKY